MKKYLIAGLAAVAIASMAAFAASLTVDGATLQAGTDNDLTCTDSADIGWVTQVSGDGQFHVNDVTITFDSAACDGKYAYLSILHSPTVQVGFGIKAISSNSVTFGVNEAAANSLAEDITQVSVLVKDTNDAAPAAEYLSGIVND